MNAPKHHNVLALVGSLRKASFNALVARQLGALAPSGMTVSIAPSLGDIPHFDSDVLAAGLPAPVAALNAAITAADGVVIVTPEYNYSIPGVLKNAIDWVSRGNPNPLAGKPVTLVSASMGILGGARVQYHLRQVLVFQDSFVVNKPEVFIGAVQTKVDPASGEITDDATKAAITANLTALAALIERVS